MLGFLWTVLLSAAVIGGIAGGLGVWVGIVWIFADIVRGK